MEDAHGYVHDLAPGEDSEAARYVFKNGQCLALAVALADHFGTREVVALIDPDLAGVGEPDAGLVHVWAIDPDGQWWDYDGIADVEIAREERDDLRPDARFLALGVAEAKRRLAPHLVKQEYGFARMMVDAIVAREA